MAKWTAEKRRNTPKSDFGEPPDGFPVEDQEDLDNAARLIGHSSDPDAVKRRLIAIAKRKKLKLPDAWVEDAGKSAPAIERKTFEFEVKSVSDASPGTFDIYAAEFGTIDRANEKIAPNAFKNLDTFVKDGFFAISHEWKHLPAGTIDSAEMDGVGLRVRGTYHSHAEAQACRNVMRERMERGKSVKLSIGYTVTSETKAVENGKPYRLLTGIDLFECSFVTVPANPNAVAVRVKSHGDEDSETAPLSTKADGAMSESDDTSGGATVPEDPMPQIGTHVKWGAYAKGMDPGCGSVKALFTSGEHGGMVATKSSPVASVYMCKDMDEMGMDPEDAETKGDDGCQCGGKDESSAKAASASKCMMTKSIAHHPVDELDAKPGTPKPFADDDTAGKSSPSPAPVYTPGSLKFDGIPAHLEVAICELLGIDPATGKAADGGETPTVFPTPSLKGALLGDTDEAMACAAFDRLHRILGYYVFAQLYSDADPDVVASSVGAAIDEYKGELLRMLGGILIADDPEDGEGTADAPTSTPAMQPDAYGYGMMSARADSLASKHIESLLSVFARSHDTSRDGVVTALALEGKVRALASEVGDLIAVHARHQLLRKKEGRTLSSATRSRIKDVQEGITSLLGDLNALLAETEPKPKVDDTKAAEVDHPVAGVSEGVGAATATDSAKAADQAQAHPQPATPSPAAILAALAEFAQFDFEQTIGG